MVDILNKMADRETCNMFLKMGVESWGNSCCANLALQVQGGSHSATFTTKDQVVRITTIQSVYLYI
jgi:hypothetical protein